MTDDASWFAESGQQDAAPSFPGQGPNQEHAVTWAERFRGAVLGGAVGDALGAGVRHRTIREIQQHLGPRGVLDYLPVFGGRGMATELTQLTVFTLEALLRAKAVHRDGGEWLPTPVVRTNHLCWLYTQGVPWDYAMSAYLQTHPEPSGWLLERPELFSTRNPAGAALSGLAKLAMQPPVDAPYDPRLWPAVQPGFSECVVWAAPAMVWDTASDVVYATGANIAKMITDDRDVHAVAGLHAEILGRLIHGESNFERAVSATDARCAHSTVAAARRILHGAMFLTRDGRRPVPVELDAEFDTDRKPGEWGTALASVAATNTFADAVLMAVNQSADSSLTAALAGQLAGALYGTAAIPARWLQELELLDVMETLCADAAEAFAPPPPPPPLPKWAQRYVPAAGRGFSGPLELSPSTPVEQETTVDSLGDEFRDDGVVEPVEDIPEAEVVEEPLITETTVVLDMATAGFPSEQPEDETQAHGNPPESNAHDEPDEEPVAIDLPMTEPVVTAEEPPPAQFEDPSTVEPVGAAPEPEPDRAEPDAPTEADVVQPPSFDIPDVVDLPAEEREDAVPDLPESASTTAEPALSTEELPRPDSGHHLEASDGADHIPPSLTERVLGCFLGGALGDALGADLEFLSSQEISERLGAEGPRGLREAFGVHGAITDDTQMTLFTAEALIRGSIAHRMHGVADPLPEIQLAYQRWLHTQGVEWERAAGPFLAQYPQPDGWLMGVRELYATRAPGKTVFRALAAFGDGAPAGSLISRVNDSKGCGGVMRAAPIALYSTDPSEVFELAARAAALTHGHPSGYLSAGALAVIVQQALLGRDLDDGVWLALQVLETWEGYEETSTMLKIAVDLAEQGTPSPQQLENTLGGGWVGEQALAIAVCAALVGGDDVELALRVAAHHSGDSDSTAAICGNIVGALAGIGGLPMDWLAELELRQVIEQMALDCVAEFGVGEFFPDETAHVRPADEEWSQRYPVGPLWTPELGAAQPTELLPAVTVPEHVESGLQGGAAEPERVAESPESAPATAEPVKETLASEPEDGSVAEPPRESASSEWSRQATRVAQREFYRTDPPAPRPAPRRINGVVPNYRDD